MASFLPKSSLIRRPGFVILAVLIIGGVLSTAMARQLPPPPIAAASTATVEASITEALALDQKIISEAKSGSEIMSNLTYLSDIIGPRLTGSAALKRANDWAAEKMSSYGLSNVHLEAY